jgi:hypothetical protein
MMCENSPYVMTDSTKENLKFFKGMYQDSLTAGLERMGDSFTGEIKQPAHWNYTNFVTTITNHQQVQWPKVIELIDYPELRFGTKKSFLEFLGFFDILKSSKCELPSQEFLLGKWKTSKAQIHLLEQLIESGKIDSVLFRENKKKTIIDYDLVPPVRNNTAYLTSGMEFFTCKELVTRLVELSDTSYYQQVRNLFE